MDSDFIKTFMKKYNKDKEDLNKKFDSINEKLENIDSKFGCFDERMEKIDRKLADIEDIQGLIFNGLGGFSDKLENVRVYLSSIETKLNGFKTLNLQGEKRHNGDLYMLKIKLHKIKPIISWENNKELSNKYQEIEEDFQQLEENFSTGE